MFMWCYSLFILDMIRRILNIKLILIEVNIMADSWFVCFGYNEITLISAKCGGGLKYVISYNFDKTYSIVCKEGLKESNTAIGITFEVNDTGVQCALENTSKYHGLDYYDYAGSYLIDCSELFECGHSFALEGIPSLIQSDSKNGIADGISREEAIKNAKEAISENHRKREYMGILAQCFKIRFFYSLIDHFKIMHAEEPMSYKDVTQICDRIYDEIPGMLKSSDNEFTLLMIAELSAIQALKGEPLSHYLHYATSLYETASNSCDFIYRKASGVSSSIQSFFNNGKDAQDVDIELKAINIEKHEKISFFSI